LHWKHISIFWILEKIEIFWKVLFFVQFFSNFPSISVYFHLLPFPFPFPFPKMAAIASKNWYDGLENLYLQDDWIRDPTKFVAPPDPHFKVQIFVKIAQHSGLGGFATMYENRCYMRAFPASAWKYEDFVTRHVSLKTPCVASHSSHYETCPLHTEVTIESIEGPSCPL
jgi:hypothetical protein